jgi:hypothetical protein
MPPDRLAELRRQRALVAQHLAWIDAELTAAGAGKPPPAVERTSSLDGARAAVNADAGADTPAAAADAPAEEPIDPVLALANARADEIIEKYRATEALDPNAAKRGCLVLCGALFVLGGATLLAIYYFGYMH